MVMFLPGRAAPSFSRSPRLVGLSMGGFALTLAWRYWRLTRGHED